MNPLLRNILAVIAGIVVGGLINMGIVTISGNLIPPPEGVDVTDMQSMADNMHLYKPKHFVMPFLAHALGTLIGAILAVKIAASHKSKIAMIIAAFFLLGGIAAATMIPAPSWFEAVDLLVAYLPMGFLGHRLAGGSKV